MKSKQKSTTKITQSSLASILGISRQALAVHMKSSDHPRLDDLSGWQLLLAQKGRIGTAPPELRAEIARERLAILKETKERLARENRIANGELMPVAKAKEQAAFACGYFFADLERMERELPPRLAGATAVDAFKILHVSHETLRREAKAKFEAIGA
jgi:hypothetical protein